MIDLVSAYQRCDDPARNWLCRQGVSTETMLMWPGPVGVAKIETQELGFFIWAENGQRAFVHPIYSAGSCSEIIDVVAWLPANPSQWWTLCRTGHPLGDDQLFHAEFWDEPAVLHPSPLAWLAADGDGVVIMDWPMSGPALRSVSCIISNTPTFGREIQRRLTASQRCPEIRVRVEKAA